MRIQGTFTGDPRNYLGYEHGERYLLDVVGDVVRPVTATGERATHVRPVGYVTLQAFFRDWTDLKVVHS